jgi:twinkle protein
VEKAQAFLDQRLAMLRADHEKKIAPYLDATPEHMLRAPSDFLEALKASFKPQLNTSAMLPWGVTHGRVAFNKGELTVWAGQNGSGKSLILGQCCLDWIEQGERVVLGSFEMSPVMVLKRMARQASGGRFPSDSYLEQFIRWLSHERRFLFIDHRGVLNPKRVLAETRYAVAEEGATQIVIDNLGKVIRGAENYDGQKDLVNDLAGIAADSNPHIHLLHHIRKSDDASKVPDKYSVLGSGSISDFADQVILVYKDSKKVEDRNTGVAVDEEKPDGMLIVAKSRNNEWEGRIGLWHNPESLALRTTPDKTWARTYDVGSA